MNINSYICKHRFLSVLLIILLVFFALYFSFSAYISFSIYNICDKALKEYPYNDRLCSIISKENYEELKQRDKSQEENIDVKNIKREISHTVPFILPPITDTSYKYTYIVTTKGLSDKDSEDTLYGSHNAEVKLTLDYSAFPFKIIDVSEDP